MHKDSSEFTVDHIKAILLNVIVAGSDTSAAAVRIRFVSVQSKNGKAGLEVSSFTRPKTHFWSSLSLQLLQEGNWREDVRIKVLYCGICHTDVQNATNGWGGSTYPVVPGYKSTLS
ncbi:hypothetical protein POM88_048710 [Heracleum sosnowskyi]|uniref:Alcohol dehydrogenase n=1 Tax=Heracleum sosnowskyi TaxID=360622 RepID=A0AAD8GW99_9APIA|nr:hypothetical protein POM88_048710 [Heracleum sosnowskyi]